MRAKSLVADLVFVAVLATSLAIPVLSRTELAQNGGGGSGSGASAQSGGSGSGSGTGDGGGGEREPGGTATESSGGDAGGSGDSGFGEPDGADPAAFGREIPRVGTVIAATLFSLPPFLLVACLAELFAQVDLPAPPGAIDTDCSKVRVGKLDLPDGPFSPGGDVRAEDVRLEITIEADQTIVVEPYVPELRRNRLLLTLLAAVLLVVVTAGIAYRIGRGRRDGAA